MKTITQLYITGAQINKSYVIIGGVKIYLN